MCYYKFKRRLPCSTAAFYRQPAQGYRPVLHAAGPHVGHHRARREWMTCVGRIAFPHLCLRAGPGLYPHPRPARLRPKRLLLLAVVSSTFDMVAGGTLLPGTRTWPGRCWRAVGLPLRRSLPYRTHSAGKTAAPVGSAGGLTATLTCRRITARRVVIILLFRLTRGALLAQLPRPGSGTVRGQPVHAHRPGVSGRP